VGGSSLRLFFADFVAMGHPMNVVLMGYRCSGKTAVGRILACDLGRPFLDTDLMIVEQAGCSIETIISEKGWDVFRSIERRVIGEVSSRDDLVIATGGGVVMDEGNVQHLKRNGFVVWLKADNRVLRERMEREQRSGIMRPSLTGTDPRDEIDEVLRIRTPLYRQAGDLVVDTSRLSIREVADSIREKLP